MPGSTLKDLIDTFEQRCREPELWNCPRPLYAEQLCKRIAGPLINQGEGTYLCGTASVVQQFMRASKRDFIQFAIDLYEQGTGKLCLKGEEASVTVVTADPKLRQLNPYSYDGKPFQGDWVDWIVLSSVRSSLVQTSWRKLYPFEKPEHKYPVENFAHASALPAEVAKMLQSFGFRIIQRDAKSLITADLDSVKRANEAQAKNYYVSLYVDSFITKKYGKRAPDAQGKAAFSATATHWIVLTSSICIDEAAKTLIFSYIDYGSEKLNIEFPLTEFLRYYYGFIAASY